MLPIVLKGTFQRVALAGRGAGLERRLALLRLASLDATLISPDSDAAALRAFSVLFVAGLDDTRSEALAASAREQGVLVNVEDKPSLCDFNVPAVVRRGDLVISVSTGGQAPGLSRLIREWIERHFDDDWSAHVETLSNIRASWRAGGMDPSEVSGRLRALVRERELLP